MRFTDFFSQTRDEPMAFEPVELMGGPLDGSLLNTDESGASAPENLLIPLESPFLGEGLTPPFTQRGVCSWYRLGAGRRYYHGGYRKWRGGELPRGWLFLNLVASSEG